MENTTDINITSIPNIDVGMITTTLVIGVCFLFTIKLTTKNVQKKDQSPPLLGLGCIDVIRTVSVTKDLPGVFLKWAREMNSYTYQINMPRRHMTYISGDVDVCMQVLQDNTCIKSNGTRSFKLVHDHGDDILTAEGFFWKHSRKNIAPSFSSHQIKRMNDVVVQKTNEWIAQKLDVCAKEGKEFDVGEEMISLTLSVICDAAFEYQMSDEEKEMFLTELDVAIIEAKKGMIPLRWSVVGKWFIPEVKRGHEAGKRLAALGMKILDSYRKLPNPTKGTVIDAIARNQHYKNDKERANDIVILLIGGHDTTAFSLAWTLFELAKNQAEQSKLQDDLRSYSTTEERTNSMVLNHVIKESMRLRPVAGVGSGRIVAHDVTIKKSGEESKDLFVIPKGSTMVLSFMLLHRNPEYFDDPDTFKPSRWVNPSEKSLAALMPFSLGKRSCVGQSLAKSEIVNVLARLCADYNFSIADEGKDLTKITYQPEKALLYVRKI